MFPTPTLDPYDDGSYGFEFSALLPGSTAPKSALIKMMETWEAARAVQYTRVEYGYDFVEHPLDRRRAFHRHDEEHFLREFGVTVHEHCEEVLGQPDCDPYMGLPIDGYEAIRRFTILWGRPKPLRCSALRCMK